MLGKLNDAYQTVKNGLEVEVALATAEQKEKLANAKLALADLKDFMADLKDENRTLKEKLSLKDEVKYDDAGVAWIGTEPYCGGCLGSKGNQVRLMKLNNTHYKCPACSAIYKKSLH